MSDDPYGATIAAADEVVHRDKVVSRMTFVACVLMALLFGGIAIGGAVQGAIAGAVGVGLFALFGLAMALTRSVLRTVVTRTELRIHWGLWGPTIPLASISSVRVRRASRDEMLRATKEPGRPRIEIQQIPDVRDIVEVEWTDEAGKGRRAWIGANDAPSLAAAIERARGSGLRIGSPAGASTDAEAERAAEVEAQAEAEAAGPGATLRADER